MNDIELLEKTKEGRNINRHYYTQEEIDVEVERPVVQKLFNILKFRNSNPAFDGDIQIEQLDENNVVIAWKNLLNEAKLEANLLTKAFTISQKEKLADWERVVL